MMRANINIYLFASKLWLQYSVAENSILSAKSLLLGKAGLLEKVLRTAELS